MLVMTTIFMTVMQMLPSTAYVKMVDIFLIFGQLYPFAEVVLLTIMEYHRESDGSSGEKGSVIRFEENPSVSCEEKPTIGSEEKPVSSEEETTVVTVDAGKRRENKLYWLKVTGKNISCFTNPGSANMLNTSLYS